MSTAKADPGARPTLAEVMADATFHHDPAHGWLEVARAHLDRLGVAHRISTYSYQRAGRVYLEEDCDAPRFLDAFSPNGPPSHARPARTVYHAGEAPCRRFARYQPR